VLSVVTFLLLFQHIVKSDFYYDWAYRTAWLQLSSHGFWSGLSGYFMKTCRVRSSTLVAVLRSSGCSLRWSGGWLSIASGSVVVGILDPAQS
jgi:hypothetical protein